MQSLRAYRLLGRHLVNGWMEPDVVDMLRILRDCQRAHGLDAHVAEIGVHHGKLFIPLQLVSSPASRALAIDVFDDQALNIDQSGKGNHARFLRNVSRWGRRENLVIRQADSTTVTAAEILEALGGPVQLFSVDGGHTRGIVRSDMTLAAMSLVPGGIIIADDVFNDQWPGVIHGTLDYLSSDGSAVPFAIGFNKVFFTTPSFANEYRLGLERLAIRNLRWDVKQSEFADSTVTVIFRRGRGLRRLAARIPLARTLYRRIRGRS